MSDPTPSQPPLPGEPGLVPLGLRVASTLCWIAGALTILLSLALGIPALSSTGSVLLLAINMLAGLAVCAAAVLLRRRQQLGVLLLVLAWGSPTALALMYHQTPRGGSVLLFAAMLFSLANWKHLQ